MTDLRRAVQLWYGVTYQSVVSYYTLFDRCDFSYHQPTKVFKSCNEAAVMEFETLLEKNDRHRPRRARDGYSGRR